MYRVRKESEEPNKTKRKKECPQIPYAPRIRSFSTPARGPLVGGLCPPRRNSVSRESTSLARVSSLKTEVSTDGELVKISSMRPVWQPKNLTVFALLAYTLGLGNIWRFPYHCMKHGGLVYVLVYLIALVLVAFPLLVLFMVPAQYCGRSSLVMLTELAPVAVGIGWSLVLIEGIVCVYYNVFIAWIMYYFYAIISGMSWLGQCSIVKDSDLQSFNSSGKVVCNYTAEQFFLEQVIHEPEEPWAGFGHLVDHNAACLAVAWLFVFTFFTNNIFKATKVLYFFVLLPLVVLILLFLLALLTAKNFEYTFRIELKNLLGYEIWLDACEHIFFTFGLTFSGVSAISSHNSILRNLILDALLQVLFDFCVSFVAFVLVSLTLGDNSSPSNDLLTYFVVYPKAMARTDLGYRLSAIFFVMIGCIGMNSQVMSVLSLIINLSDRWEQLRGHRLLVSGCVCAVLLLLGLPLVTGASKHLVLLLERSTTGPAALFLCLLHTVVISRCCGFERLMAVMSDVLQLKTPKFVKLYLRATWMFITPLLLLSISVASLVRFLKNISEFESLSEPDIWGEIVINVFILVFGLVFTLHKAFTQAGPMKDLFRPTPAFAPQFYRSSWSERLSTSLGQDPKCDSTAQRGH
ncbi:Sodium:neurotransmitter symporter [Trinorchestia longiramus]|nr:Sodium:neurotransmitter symporter [Trinorchestia longiramus]